MNIKMLFVRQRIKTCLSKVKAILIVIWFFLPMGANSATTLNISQVPLSLVIPSRPQVLFAITNSQSMDGTLSGAIMTGSGSLPLLLSSLNNSSSPLNYLVPANFTPPMQAANGSGYAPYTVNSGGVLYDNGASRLNVAKAGISAIIQAYMETTDFALEIYRTSNTNVYKTWVYYMSPPGSNFVFTNTPIAGNRYVINPCYGYPLASATVLLNCTAIAPLYGALTLANSQFMQIGSSSDDPTINDVLYSSGNLAGVFDTYNGPNPATPYPPNFSLANYNNGSVLISYNSSSPNIGGFGTSPTNAGFVPFSQQVMYSQRGFGYYSVQSANTGNVIVPMTNLGSSPSAASILTAINLFNPWLKPETNSSTSTEIKAEAVQGPMAGLLARARTYMTSLVATGTSCPPKKYVILISDGLPTQDQNNKLWPPLGSAAAAGYNVTATFNGNGSLNTTNDQALTDTITSIANLNADGIKTYIIGLGAGVDPTINPQAAATLTAMAIAGGTVNYYPATSPTALVNDLNNILLAIQNGTFFITSSAVSSTSLQSGTQEFQASFTSSDTPYQDWTGNLFESQLDPITGLPVGAPTWYAQPQLDAKVSGTGWLNNRFIATWNPTFNTTGGGVPFAWANLNAAQQLQLQPSDLLGANRVQYLRGNTALEIRNGGIFRNRSHILGDLVDSQPLYVGTPADVFFFNASYRSFIASESTRAAKVYVGSNDGMLHAFDALTGIESFAYIPNGVMNNLYNLSAQTYNQSHLFFVNGSPHSGDVQFANGTWHTLLVGGESAGGKSIYALDITSPQLISSETVLATRVLWEFTDVDLGLTYSQPKIVPINPGTTTTSQTFAVFFGNGYNSLNNKSVLYALNPQTGAVLAKINLCAAVPGTCVLTQPQGLSTIAYGNQNGQPAESMSQIYAGDLQGNLWAIDISNPIPAQWTVRLLFQARDSGGNPQPITTQPLVTLHPLYPRLQGLFVMFGTGQFLTLADVSNQQQQTVYGVWDKPLNNQVYNRNNLQAQTLTLVTATTSGLTRDILVNSTNAVSWALNVGWFVDLVAGGQRVITNPQLLNGAFVTTLITPPGNVCIAPFASMLLELNYQTGGAFYFPQLDINNTGVINSSDQYNGSYPVGMTLAAGYVSMPTILGPNINNNLIKLFTQASGQQISVINPNNSPRLASWWQIQ